MNFSDLKLNENRIQKKCLKLNNKNEALLKLQACYKLSDIIDVQNENLFLHVGNEFTIYFDFGVACLNVGTFADRSVNETVTILNKYEMSIGKMLELVNSKVSKGQFVRNDEIKILELLGYESKSFVNARQDYIDAKEAEANEKKLAREIEFENKLNEKLETLELKIKNGENGVTNNGDCLIMLFKKHGVNVPAGVIGWIRKSLLSVSYRENKFTGFKYSGGNSYTFAKYFKELERKIKTI